MTSIPKYQQPALDGSGLFTLPWRRWLEAVNAALNSAGSDNLSLAASVAALAEDVAAIPTAAVIRGRDGVTVEGSLAGGVVTIGYIDTAANNAAVMARISLRC